ncbi:hypothetical protein TNCV_507841 [Trichonephila clavipes]|nr:hypothetical protein TNCV_507841 [Trichonephila clavipes]
MTESSKSDRSEERRQTERAEHPRPSSSRFELTTLPCQIPAVLKSEKQETGLISRRRLRKRVKDLRFGP